MKRRNLWMPAGLLLLLLVATAGCRTAAGGRELGEADFLSASGTDLVNARGETVVLRGFNLGGWLAKNIYMSPLTGRGVGDESDLYRVLTRRFGGEGMTALLDLYHENYITETDLDTIARMGANSVRVPFWWRNFMTGDGEFIRDRDGRPDFSRLDWVVRACAARGLYVILDLHGAPGSQNGAHYSGTTTRESLFARTPEGARWRRLSVKLWRALAEHFAEEPAVAGYDLMNEPYWRGVITGPAQRQWVWEHYHELYRAIRAVDRRHLIILESCWDMSSLPAPEAITPWKDTRWENVVYSMHYYPRKHQKTDDEVRRGFFERLERDLVWRDRYQVPLYVGETNFHERWTVWETALAAYDRYGVSCSVWSYKCPIDDTTVWGLAWRGPVRRADVTVMSREQIAAVWSLRTEQCMRPNERARALLTRYFSGRLGDSPPSR